MVIGKKTIEQKINFFLPLEISISLLAHLTEKCSYPIFPFCDLMITLSLMSVRAMILIRREHI